MREFLGGALLASLWFAARKNESIGKFLIFPFEYSNSKVRVGRPGPRGWPGLRPAMDARPEGRLCSARRCPAGNFPFDCCSKPEARASPVRSARDSARG